MAAGWTELTSIPGIELKVIAWSTKNDNQVGFSETLTSWFDCDLIDSNNLSFEYLSRVFREYRPDVIVVPGWMSSQYRQLAVEAVAAGCRVVMGMDTPLNSLGGTRKSIRQNLTRYRYGKFLKSVSQVVVASERTWQYARRLGFPESRIRRGVYCYDDNEFGYVKPSDNSPTRSGFLYVGRFAPEKGLDTLLGAYQEYRNMVKTPWSLSCAGMGPLQTMLSDCSGVSDLGFVDPKDLSQVYGSHSVFVLPSHYEPWGVALAEALASGTPVIASEACGAAVDLLRYGYNGIQVATGDKTALRNALLWMHEQSAAAIESLRQNAAKSAEPFGAKHWARRWADWLQADI